MKKFLLAAASVAFIGSTASAGAGIRAPDGLMTLNTNGTVEVWKKDKKLGEFPNPHLADCLKGKSSIIMPFYRRFLKIGGHRDDQAYEGKLTVVITPEGTIQIWDQGENIGEMPKRSLAPCLNGNSIVMTVDEQNENIPAH